MTHQAIISCPLGTVSITADESGVKAISVSDGKPEQEIVPENLAQVVSELREYFDGARGTFSFILNPEGTEFQKRVWNALLEIPFGSTISYFDLARTLGDVKAIRAVASANGKNALWIAVPCHRVIGSDGSLTGYAGGLWRKKWLLEHENPSAQQSLFER